MRTTSPGGKKAANCAKAAHREIPVQGQGVFEPRSARAIEKRLIGHARRSLLVMSCLAVVEKQGRWISRHRSPALVAIFLAEKRVARAIIDGNGARRLAHSVIQDVTVTSEGISDDRGLMTNVYTQCGDVLTVVGCETRLSRRPVVRKYASRFRQLRKKV